MVGRKQREPGKGCRNGAKFWKVCGIFGVMLILQIGFMAGCSRQPDSDESPVEENSEEDIFSGLDNEAGPQDVEQLRFSGGVKNQDGCVLYYTGTPVELDYEMEIESQATVRAGLQLLVNGVIQPITVDGKETEMYVQSFDSEKREFHISFTPILGEKGEELDLLFTHVLNLEVLEPNDDGNLDFGHNHKRCSTSVWTLNMQADSPGERRLQTEERLASDNGQGFQVVSEEMSKEERNSYITTDFRGNRRDKLEYLHIQVGEKEESVKGVLTLGDREYLDIALFGGGDTTWRVSCYSNFQPIMSKDKIYMELTVKDGRKTIWRFPAEDIPSDTNFYILAVPMDGTDLWLQSPSYYISAS